MCLSTHDLTQRSTGDSVFRLPIVNRFFSFNSRPHAEVDTKSKRYTCRRSSFQLTTSRRGRLIPLSFRDSGRIFQLTTSRRGRPNCCHSKQPPRTFQLTTSRRGRLYCFIRLHGGVRLSTHDLTQRSTRLMSPCPMVAFLSTHDLTQRSTLRSLRLLVRRDLSTHDLTQRSTRITSEKNLFILLSTHDLTQRSTSPHVS